MTTEKQPEALRLAYTLDLLGMDLVTPRKAAAELRRQHARIAELEAEAAASKGGDWAVSRQHPVLMKNDENNAASIIEDAARELSNGYAVNFHDVAARVLASSKAEIAELKAQLESIGAGGVTALVKKPAQSLQQGDPVLLTDAEAHEILLDMSKHIEDFCDDTHTAEQLSQEAVRFIVGKASTRNITAKTEGDAA